VFFFEDGGEVSMKAVDILAANIRVPHGDDVILFRVFLLLRLIEVNVMTLIHFWIYPYIYLAYMKMLLNLI
jgi:hypothetical protein